MLILWTCISNYTKNNLLKYIQHKNVTVVYNPIDPSYHYVQKDFNSQKPVILHLGTKANKNLKRTILALEGINCHLRIIGKLDNDTEDLLKLHRIEYSNQYNLSDLLVMQEYIACDIVNFPSTYEGFGMPIIEAQKIGR